MPIYAHQYLLGNQKNEIRSMAISHNRISATLTFDFHVKYKKKCQTIRYEQVGPDTVISDGQPKNEITVEDVDFVTVYCADIKSIFINRKSIFKEFSMYRTWSEKFEKEYRKTNVDPLSDRIHECFKYAKNQKLEVKELHLEPTGLNQVKIVLEKVALKFMEKLMIRMEICDESLSLKTICELEMLKESTNLYLEIDMDELTVEDLVYVVKLFQTSICSELRIWYNKIDMEGLETFFEKPVIHKRQDMPKQKARPIENGDYVIVEFGRTFGRMNFYRMTYYNQKNTKRDDDDFSDTFSFLFTETNQKCLKVLGNPLIIGQILKFGGFFEIQSLSKTCSITRRAIQISKLDPKIDEIHITLHGDGAVLIKIVIENLRPREIIYMENDAKCYIPNKITSKNTHLNAVEDIFNNLKNQKNPLKMLKLDYDRYFVTRFTRRVTKTDTVEIQDLKENIRKFMEIFETKIFFQTEKLSMMVMSQDNILDFLPNFNPKYLKFLELKWFFGPLHRIEIDQISELEQWKNLEGLQILELKIPKMWSAFSNFSKISIHVDNVTMEDLFELKEILLKSTKLMKFEVKFTSTTVDHTSHDLLGLPYFRPNDPMMNIRKTWYYRFPDGPDGRKVLLVLFFIEKKAVTFSRVEFNAIPVNAISN